MQNKKRITITDVAIHAQVSPTSVSRHINGVEGNLSPATSQRIAKAIKDLGYRPNAWARSLKSQRSGLIAAIVADLNKTYILGVLEGIEHIVAKTGFSLLISSTQNDPQKQAVIMERLLGQRIEGIIVQPCSDQLSKPLKDALDNKVPIVLVDRLIPQLSYVDSVALDNIKAIDTMLEHFKGVGYKKVLYVTDSTDSISSRQEREQEVLKAQIPDLLIQIYTRQDGEDAWNLAEMIQVALDQSPTPVVLLASNEDSALFSIKALKLANLEVPKDLGFATIDDPEWAFFAFGGVTSLRQPTLDIGHEAANLLIQKIQTPNISDVVKLRLPGKLIPRISTTSQLTRVSRKD